MPGRASFAVLVALCADAATQPQEERALAPAEQHHRELVARVKGGARDGELTAWLDALPIDPSELLDELSVDPEARSLLVRLRSLELPREDGAAFARAIDALLVTPVVPSAEARALRERVRRAEARLAALDAAGAWTELGSEEARDAIAEAHAKPLLLLLRAACARARAAARLGLREHEAELWQRVSELARRARIPERELQAELELVKLAQRTTPIGACLARCDALAERLDSEGGERLRARIADMQRGLALAFLEPQTRVDAARAACAEALPRERDPVIRAILAANLAADLRVEGRAEEYESLLGNAAALVQLQAHPRALAALEQTRAEAAYASDVSELLALADSALEHARRADDVAFLASTCVGIAWLQSYAERFERAEELLDEAEGLARSLAHRNLLAVVRFRRGVLQVERGALDEGLLLQRESLRELEALEMRAVAVTHAEQHAFALVRIGRAAEALAALEGALAIQRAAGFAPAALLGPRAQRAHLLGICGRTGEALAAAEQVLRDAEQLGDAFAADRARLERGALLARVGRHEEASADLERAAHAFERSGVAANARYARLQRAELASALAAGPRAAREELRRFLEGNDLEGEPELRAELCSRCAELALDAGDLESARSDLDALLEADAALGGGRLRALARMQHARLELLSGRCESAEREARAAADGLRHVGDRARAAEALGWAGLAAARLGRIGSADDAVRRSILDASVAARSLLDEEAAFVRAPERRPLEALLALHWSTRSGAEPTEDALERGFWHAEQLRGRGLRQALHSSAASLAARLPLELQARLARRRAELERADRGVDAALRAERGSSIEDATRARERAVQSLDETLRELRGAAGNAGDLLQVEPCTLAEARRALGPSRALLVLRIAEGRLFGLAASATQALARDLGAAQELESIARTWRAFLADETSEDRALASELYERCLRPFEAVLREATRLVVSSDGAVLSLVPFEAMLERSDGRERRLIERWCVSYVPSISSWLALQEGNTAIRGTGVLALGDPLYPAENAAATTEDARSRSSYARLAGSGAEARAVWELAAESQRGPLLLREAATRAALLEALRTRRERLRCVHLACHGIVDTRWPRLTGLLLAHGELLTIDDLLGVPIDADLAVLSACRTSGELLLEGEGLFGLARAFFVAGCPRVIVAFGPVDDAGARAPMRELERLVVREGLAPADALRAVKLDALRRGGAGAHPKRWAGFVLWGLDS